MPTLPLYHTPDVPNAWHRVTAPGGYEWWHFDAEDEAGDVRVVARVYDGYAFHPGYVRATRRYLRRPTRRTPPVPRDYPCAELAVYRGGAVWGRFVRVFAPGALTASATGVDVAVGPNHITADGDGLRLDVSDGAIGVALTFRPAPSVVPATIPLFEGQQPGATHRWTVVQPSCAVEGMLMRGGERLPFQGRGYHDHQFGTSPIPGTVGWIRGRAMFGDRAYAFHVTQLPHGASSDERHLFIADGKGLLVLPTGVNDASCSLRDGSGVRYPDGISLTHGLLLTKPVVLDALPLRLRIAYVAWSEAGEGRAFCEVVRADRLWSPVVGRLIERSLVAAGERLAQ